LKVLGIADPVNFDFIEKPTLSSLRYPQPEPEPEPEP
jgi:hypothetical protein